MLRGPRRLEGEKKKASISRGLPRDRFSQVPVYSMVTEALGSVKARAGFQAVPGDACLESWVSGGGTRTRIGVLDGDLVYPFNLPRIPTLNTVEREVLFPACLRAGRRETGGGG